MVELITTIGAIIIISIWSMPFKETLFSRFGEFTFVGLAAAVLWYTNLRTLYNVTLLPMATGNYQLIIPVILGSIIFIRPFYRKVGNLALWPMAMMMGFALGTNVAGLAITQFWNQIIATAKFSMNSPLNIFTGLLMMVITITVLISFTTTFEHKGTTVGRISEVGRWALTLAFGTGLGNFIMSRIGMIASILQWLMYLWLGLGAL